MNPLTAAAVVLMLAPYVHKAYKNAINAPYVYRKKSGREFAYAERYR